MEWNEVVELITVTHSDDANVIITETSRPVYAEKRSVTRSEHYQAIANGLRPSITFIIHAFEYLNEQKLSFEGQEYLILRTFAKDFELLELICQAHEDVQTNLARLRDSVEIWQNIFVENSMGELVANTERLYILPAQVEYNGGGNSSPVGDVIETSNTVKVTIKYRSGIRPDMFLTIGGQRFDIRYIEDPYNRHETLTLHAERKVP